MSAARWAQLGLRGRMIALVGGAAALSTGLLVGALLWGLHQHLHAQTDRVLLELAQHDAADVLLERDQGIHVHDAPVALPSLSGEVAVKHAMVVGAGCAIRASTRSLPALEAPPQALCEAVAAMPGSAVFDVDALGPELLRVGAVRGQGPSGEPLVFLVGVEHAELDRSTWELTGYAIPGGLLAVVVVVLVVGWAAARVTRDLEGLTEACGHIAAAEAMGGRREGWQERFDAAPGAPPEVATLALTLRRLLAQTGEALEAQERFVAEASHELNTPLTALRGELEVTLRRERSREDYREALENAYEDTQRLIALSEHLLQAARARGEAASLSVELLEPLVAASLERMASQADAAGVQLSAAGDPAARAWVEPVGLGRALDNLLGNALLHAQARSVSVRWAELPAAAGEPRRVEVVVEDDGVGVPASLVPRLFQPFQRASQARGHGLGLAIARALLRQQGGELRFEPGGAGARWVLQLRAA